MMFYDNKYFTKKELSCKCCGKLELDKDFLDRLLKIRKNFAMPILVNSCYRCPKHNKEVGGHPNSYHTQGMAIDIKHTENKDRLIRLFIEGGWAVGLYSNFFHADIRTFPTYFRGKY